jgi:hypothetical protein
MYRQPVALSSLSMEYRRSPTDWLHGRGILESLLDRDLQEHT